MITVRSASRPPVRGSSSSAELVDDVGHLVAALAAAHVDDHVGVAPLGDLLQQHGLAGAEAAGHGGGAAPRDREEHVEHPLAGDQRRRALQPSGVRAAGGAPASRSPGHVGAADPRDRRRRRRSSPSAASVASDARRRRAGRARGARPRRRPAPAEHVARRRTVAPSRVGGHELPPPRRRLGPVGARAAATSGAPASGRSSPSNTPPSRPGPSRADSGSPRRRHRVAGRAGRRCTRRPGR